MSNFQPCSDSSDVVDLYPSLGLYLKPIAKLNISVQLPQLKNAGKSISNWEVMEKIRGMTKPYHFTMLKVVKSTLECIKFEGEAENKSAMKSMITKLETKSIKLRGFTDPLKVKAGEAKLNFPTRHDWDSYFRDAKNMNEMEPGERPDTINFQSLPSRWFADSKNSNRNSKEDERPNENSLKDVCQKFGDVCFVDIPMLDPYRCENHSKSLNGSIPTFSFGQDLMFEAFVQFKEYAGFVSAMNSFRGMKLMYTDGDGKSFTATIKVDFDKTKHLSQNTILKREKEREKLMQLEKKREERVIKEHEEDEKRKGEERKKQIEEDLEKERKRKEKILKQEERQRIREEKRRLRKIERKQMEEKLQLEKEMFIKKRKEVLNQRKIEAARMFNLLFQKIQKIKLEEDLREKEAEIEVVRKRQLKEMEDKVKEEQRKKELTEEKMKQKLIEQEEQLKLTLVRKMKRKREKQEEETREGLRKKLSSKRSKLKSVLVVSTS